MSAGETRIDLEDGLAYTYEEMSQYYAGKKTPEELQQYWAKCTPVRSTMKDALAKHKSAGSPTEKADERAEEQPGAVGSSDSSAAAAFSPPARGRALLRAVTDSSLNSSETPHSSAQDSARVLRRVQSMQVGGAQVGRIGLTRSASSERIPKLAKRQSFLQPEHHEEKERAASVPPPPARSVDAAEEEWIEVKPGKGKHRGKGKSRHADHRPQLLRAVSREISQEVRDAVHPAAKVLNRDVRRQLRLVVGGLMGSGKSTLCRMLAHLLEGTWVNQDEFSHLGRGAKRGFLAEIKNVSQDSKVPVLIVDKINTMQQHRGEILEAMKHGVNGDVVFIQIAHPLDPPTSLQHTMELCLSRIRNRGEGHRTLLGTDPKLAQILKMAASGYEPLEGHDINRFNAHFRADMTLTPTVSVMQLLADLDDEGLLGRFHVEDLITQDSIMEAFEVSQEAEQQLKKGKEQAPAKNKKESAPLWIFVVAFDASARTAIRNAWQLHGSKDPELHLQDEFHVTLLFLGGRADKQIAARQSTLHSAADVAKLREKLQSCEGKEIELTISSINWDNKIACAEIVGLDGICANVHAHSTLALKKGTPPVMSNELLARKYANEDLEAGLKEWLMQLGIDKYEDSIRRWCKTSGVSTADAVAKKPADVAQAVERNDKDQQARVKTILTRAAQGEITSIALEEPIKLTGRIHGKLRGE